MSDERADQSPGAEAPDAERAERDALIAWFVRRYPTAEARLDYAIRKRRTWRAVQRRGAGYRPDDG